jgi:lipopolysaccharide biosynthesis protein
MVYKRKESGSKGKAVVHGMPTGRPSDIDQVRDRAGELLSRYANGESWHSIGQSLEYPIPGHRLSHLVTHNVTLRRQLAEVQAFQAQAAFERACDMARATEAEDTGKAADLWLKIAARLDPARYSEKSTVNLTVAQKVDELSDEELARIAARPDVIDVDAREAD